MALSVLIAIQIKLALTKLKRVKELEKGNDAGTATNLSPSHLAQSFTIRIYQYKNGF